MCVFLRNAKRKELDTLVSITDNISSLLWGWPLITLLLGTHIYLTIRLRFPQRYLLTAIKLSFAREKGSNGDVSAFGALSTALAATIGTGNIVGVGTAIAMGGPGAVFWCWLTGVLGIATKYSEALLAVKYRVKTENGEMIGGPMFALERGLHAKWLAVLFCIFASIAAFGIGNMVQANSVSQLLNDTCKIPFNYTGYGLCLIVAMVMFFGVKGIAKVCTVLVPFMAAFYVLGCIVILAINSQYIMPAIHLIMKAAFNPAAAGGGLVGSGIIMTMRYGVSRGLFSNESGLGSAPIVAAAAKTRNPVRQALVSSTGTFWDTVIICAMTGIVLTSCIIANPHIDTTAGTNLINTAFNSIPIVGPVVLSVGLLTFTVSTLLGWSYYGEKAIEYLGGKKLIIYYHILWVIAIYIGSTMKLKAVWNIADCMNAMMAIPNLISLLLLSGVLVRETRKYLWSGNIGKWDRNELSLAMMEREKRIHSMMRKNKKRRRKNIKYPALY